MPNWVEGWVESSIRESKARPVRGFTHAALDGYAPPPCKSPWVSGKANVPSDF